MNPEPLRCHPFVELIQYRFGLALGAEYDFDTPAFNVLKEHIDLNAFMHHVLDEAKSTEQWISTQFDVMPDCENQHITLTMPSELWPIFEVNPTPLNDLLSLAADTLLNGVKQHGLEVGMFDALHTYGRGLNWHPHIHLSVTRGGLDKHNIWRPIYFKKKHVEYHWRRCLIGLLRRKYGELNL